MREYVLTFAPTVAIRENCRFLAFAARSTWKPDSFEELSFQLSVTARPEPTDPFRFDGAAGALGAALTVIESVVECVAPWLSVTVSAAV